PLPTTCDPPRVCDDKRWTCVDAPATPCHGPADCTAEAPVCSPAALCTGCEGSDTACEPFAAVGMAHCDDRGACVECRIGMMDCPAKKPICDGEICRGCRQDSECASQACQTDTGVCIAEANVIYMSSTGTGSSCSKAQPCGSFAMALGLVTADRKTIKMAA